MPNNLDGRSIVLQALQEELVGPSPHGKEIDCMQPISFDDAKESYGPWRQKGSGEEILLRDSPCKRYGVGVLYPMETQEDELSQDPTGEAFIKAIDTGEDASHPEYIITDQAQQLIDEIDKRADESKFEPESYDFDLSSANAFKQSSMGISFLAELPGDAVLVVEATGGCYHKRVVTVEGQERIWWLRSPVSIRTEYDAHSLFTSHEAKVKARFSTTDDLEGLDIKIELFSRPYQSNQERLITICLVNRQEAKSQVDQHCLFQTHFRVSIISARGQRFICPYPSSTNEVVDTMAHFPLLVDQEEQSLALLYRKATTFAVGHGCAANWESVEGTWQALTSLLGRFPRRPLPAASRAACRATTGTCCSSRSTR